MSARRWNVQLLDARGLDRAGRLRMSAGITRAEAAGESQDCAPGAWVPRLPWRRLAPDELDELERAGESGSSGRTIEVITPRAGAAGARPTRLLEVARNADPGDDEDEADVIDLAVEWLMPLLRRDGHCFQFAGPLRLSEKPPGRRTSTIDPQQGSRRLGMHVDSHERRAFDARDECRRLLSLNASSEPREFLFVPIHLGRICDIVRHAQGDRVSPQWNATDLAREFFALEPDTRVIAVELAPGDAYLAPVQNMPHDGSTSRMTATDLTVSVFGEFFPIGEREPAIPAVFATA